MHSIPVRNHGSSCAVMLASLVEGGLTPTQLLKLRTIVHRPKPRKNLDIVARVVNFIKANGIEEFPVTMVEDIIKACDWENRWERDPLAKDDFGLRKSLGDLLGGHGLGLQTKWNGKMKYYIVPPQPLAIPEPVK